MIRTAVPWGVFLQKYYLFCDKISSKYCANLEILSCKFYFINLSIRQDPKNNWRVRTSRVSRSASIRVHVEVRNG